MPLTGGGGGGSQHRTQRGLFCTDSPREVPAHRRSMSRPHRRLAVAVVPRAPARRRALLCAERGRTASHSGCSPGRPGTAQRPPHPPSDRRWCGYECRPPVLCEPSGDMRCKSSPPPVSPPRPHTCRGGGGLRASDSAVVWTTEATLTAPGVTHDDVVVPLLRQTRRPTHDVRAHTD